MKRVHHKLRSLCAAAALMTLVLAAGVPAIAAESKLLGSFDNWSAHQFTEGDGPVCYLYSVPTKTAGEYTKRGDTYVQVTHRVGDKTRDVVSVTAGYPYKKDSEVTVTIDGKKFSLFTDSDTAWAGDAAADGTLVAAMRAGVTMVVEGMSGRGTLTTDTYSLAGFTAAHKAIDQACKVK